MSDAPTTLRALAAACEECLQAARTKVDDFACVDTQRLALMGALPDVTGWEQTAAALRTMADTVDALEAKCDKARAVIALIAEACATPGCEDLASALTPSDYGALVEHVAVIASACDALRAEVAKSRAVILALAEAADTWKWGVAQHSTPLPQGLDTLLSVLNVSESYDDHTAGEIAEALRALAGVDHG